MVPLTPELGHNTLLTVILTNCWILFVYLSSWTLSVCLYPVWAHHTPDSDPSKLFMVLKSVSQPGSALSGVKFSKQMDTRGYLSVSAPTFLKWMIIRWWRRQDSLSVRHWFTEITSLPSPGPLNWVLGKLWIIKVAGWEGWRLGKRRMIMTWSDLCFLYF